MEDEACVPDLLGLAWEQLLASAARREQGAHFTPSKVADLVVELAFGSTVQPVDVRTCRVWDPTAGGGAFLLASARATEALHRPSAEESPEVTQQRRANIVTHCFATDIDPVALRVCDAALEMLSLIHI